ncbi:MAG TPA: hypothetical protein VEB19_16985 [Gemmatimonadaceae bacterium]|nr:hypothetical protein [Gemmatimonadaceae bacterium]
MERNDGNGLGDTGQTDANEFSGSGSTQQPDTTFDFNGTTGNTGSGDRAKSAGANRVADVGAGLREKAGTAKNKLVGALEAGAERLRDRSQGGAQLAGATADASVAIEGDQRMTQVTDKVAGGMQATADFLRDADLQGMKMGIERQVKEHPGRTLLIAAGLGYILGRAFRK